MNDKGRRMVKERIKGQGEERTHNIYYGIDEGILLDERNIEFIVKLKLKEVNLRTTGIKKVRK